VVAVVIQFWGYRSDAVEEQIKSRRSGAENWSKTDQKSRTNVGVRKSQSKKKRGRSVVVVAGFA